VNHAPTPPVNTLLPAALRALLTDDPRVHLLGEAVDLSPATAGLRAAFPGRVHLLPAADATLTGIAVGMAFGGARPIVELSGPASIWGALQQLGQEAAPARRAGEFRCGVVLRVPVGPGEPLPLDLLAGVPELGVAVASSAQDAVDLLRSALAGDQPVVIFEPAMALARPAAAGTPARSIGAARLAREGDRATLLAHGDGVAVALAAAERLAGEGVEIEVLDLGSLQPLDRAALSERVQRTGRALVVGGPLGLLSTVTELAFLRLEAPPVVVPAELEAVTAALRLALSF
jgi:2-oxoisovalerate dehydrogenase E1 component beta subunit